MRGTDDKQPNDQPAETGVPNSHPKAMYFIFWGEFAERSSYYGMRAILFLYLSINVGAFISLLALPWLRDKFGYAVAFQFPAWLMVGSLAVFAAGKRHYTLEPIKKMTPEEERQKWDAMVSMFGNFALLFWFV